MHNAKKYLEKIGVKFPADSSEWKEVNNYYREIRNKIMHEGGFLSSIEKTVRYAQRKQIVLGEGVPNMANQHLRLELTRPFCEEALKNFEKLLLNVHSAYEDWLTNRK